MGRKRKGAPGELCPYCRTRPTETSDHIIARSFFPREERWTRDLPKVPSCDKCQTKRSKLEGELRLILAFGDTSEGAFRLLTLKAKEDLAKNLRLLRELRKAWGPARIRMPSGNVEERKVLSLSPKRHRDLFDWYAYIVKGFYRHDAGIPLPIEHRLYLKKPRTQEQYQILRDIVCQPGHTIRQFGSGEFKVASVITSDQDVSCWMFSFRSAAMFGSTIAPGAAPRLQEVLDGWEWPPDRESN